MEGINKNFLNKTLKPSDNLEDKEKPLPFGRINQPLSEYFKENKIEAPPIEMIIAFTRHSSESDADFLEPYIRDTDIFIPEGSNWNENAQKGYQNLSDKKIFPKNLAHLHSFPDFDKRVAQLIYDLPPKKLYLWMSKRDLFYREKKMKRTIP